MKFYDTRLFVELPSKVEDNDKDDVNICREEVGRREGLERRPSREATFRTR